MSIPGRWPSGHPLSAMGGLVCLLLMLLVSGSGQALTRLEEDRARLDSLRNALDALQTQAAELATREEQDLQKLDRTQRSLSSTQSLIQELESHGRRLEERSGRTRESIQRSALHLQSLAHDRELNGAEHARLLAETRAVVNQVWRNRRQDPLYWLLASGDVGEAWRRARWFPWFGAGVERGARRLQDNAARLVSLENRTTAEQERQAALLKDLEASRREAEAARAENERRARQLDQERLTLNQTLDRVRTDRSLKEARALQTKEATGSIAAQVQALEERWRKRKRQQESEAAGRENLSRILKESEGETPVVEVPAAREPLSSPPPAVDTPSDVPSTTARGDLSDLRPLRGRLPRPLNGSVRKRWGLQQDPVSGTETDNPGVDYRCQPGDPVRLVHPGTVVRTTWVPGFGNTVLVDHGSGVFTVYSKLESVRSLPQHPLPAGTVIGEAGAFDEPGEGSLHFELWLGRESQNPELWLQR